MLVMLVARLGRLGGERGHGWVYFVWTVSTQVGQLARTEPP
jgi:hypothetical protein